MTVSIIIPNYNGEKLLLKNLPRVCLVNLPKGVDLEVIVVDDGSSDDSVKVIENFCMSDKRIKLARNYKNLGFASTVNKGAFLAKGEIIVFLNTDVDPDKNFLLPSIKDLEGDNVFAVGCLEKSLEDGKVILRGRGVGVWKKGFLVHQKGEVDRNDTLWVSGGSAVVKKSIFKKLGGFNPLYNPFYWEDIDLSYRALKAGYKLVFEKESIVIHEHSKGAIKSHYSKEKIKTIAYRNQLIFTWINLTDKDLLLQHLKFLPIHFVKACLTLDMAFVKGFFKAFILLPKIIKSRTAVKGLAVKSDNQVVQTFET